MSGVQLGTPIVRLRTRGADLRGVRPRPDRPDDGSGSGVARVRRGAGREACPNGRTDGVHDPWQGSPDDDRLEEQGLLRQVDSHPEPRAAVPPSEMAAAHPCEQRDGAESRIRPERARSDGERNGFAAERPRDRRDGLPKGREQEPDPRSLNRRRGRGVPLCRVPAMQRPADARRDCELVPGRAQGNRPDIPLHDAGTETETHAHEAAGLCVPFLLRAQAERRGPVPGGRDPEGRPGQELTSGRGPTGVAAAAIYIASILCNERRTQREVADVAGVTEVTIRNRYKELTEKLGIKVEL